MLFRKRDKKNIYVYNSIKLKAIYNKKANICLIFVNSEIAYYFKKWII